MGFWFWVLAAMTLLCAFSLLRLFASIREHTIGEFVFRLAGHLLALGGCALYLRVSLRAPGSEDVLWWYWPASLLTLHLVGRYIGHPDPLGLNDTFRWPWSRPEPRTDEDPI